MADVLTRFKSGKIWDFKGGIHPPEMKSQSNNPQFSNQNLLMTFMSPLNSMLVLREMY